MNFMFQKIYLVIIPLARYLILVVVQSWPASEMYYCFCSYQFFRKFLYNFNIIGQGVDKMFFIKHIREIADIYSRKVSDDI